LDKYVIMRIVGAALLAAAMLITWFSWTWVALGALLAVAAIDIALVILKKDTISQWIHSWFPKVTDAIIMVALCVFTWFIWGFPGLLPVLMGVIIGHLFWH